MCLKPGYARSVRRYPSYCSARSGLALLLDVRYLRDRDIASAVRNRVRQDVPERVVSAGITCVLDQHPGVVRDPLMLKSAIRVILPHRVVGVERGRRVACRGLDVARRQLVAATALDQVLRRVVVIL